MKRSRSAASATRAALVDAREASRLLEIKPATLYAYVSRGMLPSVPGAHGPSRLYARSDIERLKARHVARSGHGAVAAGALRFGEPVLESALTAIDERGPRYRGHVAVELARAGTAFEAILELLWTGRAPSSFEPRSPSRATGGGVSTRRIRALSGRVPAGSSPLAALSLAVSALGLGDPQRFGAPDEAEHARARRLVHALAASVALAFDARRVGAALAAPTVAGALALAFGVRNTPRVRRALDQALIVIADHELNPSAFAARVAASTGADLYACVAAALGVLSGPEHGGATERVEALVAEIGRPERVASVIAERTRRGDALPGFGHPLYPRGDPRAALLLAALVPRRRDARVLRALVERMRALRREPPNVDVGLVATARSLGLPRGAASAIFAVGRSAGWLAHVFEQRAAGFVLRPRARYIGP